MGRKIRLMKGKDVYGLEFFVSEGDLKTFKTQIPLRFRSTGQRVSLASPIKLPVTTIHRNNIAALEFVQEMEVWQ